jgi:hypothetical protein
VGPLRGDQGLPLRTLTSAILGLGSLGPHWRFRPPGFAGELRRRVSPWSPPRFVIEEEARLCSGGEAVRPFGRMKNPGSDEPGLQWWFG